MDRMFYGASAFHQHLCTPPWVDAAKRSKMVTLTLSLTLILTLTLNPDLNGDRYPKNNCNENNHTLTLTVTLPYPYPNPNDNDNHTHKHNNKNPNHEYRSHPHRNQNDVRFTVIYSKTHLDKYVGTRTTAKGLNTLIQVIVNVKVWDYFRV